MNDEHDNFAVGDRVMCPQGFADPISGTVTKVTPATVTVQMEDGRSERFRRRKWGRAFECRKVTEADLAREAWIRALEEWEKMRPPMRRIGLSKWYRHGDYRMSLAGDGSMGSDVLDQIIEEVTALREWLSKRPEEPK